jgi:hypothetical protein
MLAEYFARLLIVIFSLQMTMMLSAIIFPGKERNMDCCHCSTLPKILFFHSAVRKLSELQA